MNTIPRLCCCLLFFAVCSSIATAEGIHHYVFFNRDRERISEPAFLETNAFEGAQLKYTNPGCAMKQIRRGIRELYDGIVCGDIRES